MNKNKSLILWFDQVGMEDIELVGGKIASLGEMIRTLGSKGVEIPYGFAITAEAYRFVLDKGGAVSKIQELLAQLDTKDVTKLSHIGKEIRKIIRYLDFPDNLSQAIIQAYHQLGEKYGYEPGKLDVAVRSSATAEDLPSASFAGQLETFLNVVGEEELLNACSRCFASLFTDRAISYRVDKGFDHYDINVAVGVQKMVRADEACAGVMFTIDTESGFPDVVLIDAAYGLGENVVQGTVNPDGYYVYKPALKQGKAPLLGKVLGRKKRSLIYASDDYKRVRNISVPHDMRERYALEDQEIKQLATWACAIEDHYSQKKGAPCPMDIEWAKDGDGSSVGTGKLFIVQARPETVHSQRDYSSLERFVLEEQGKVIVSGAAVGQKIGQGEAKFLDGPEISHQFKQGQVLVSVMTNPDWEPIMKMASAIVTDKGGRTCHAAIVSRELGIPCIVGTGDVTERVPTGSKITVSCCEGERGNVYDGLLKYRTDKMQLAEIPRTRTRIMMNVGLAEKAFSYSQIPSDGVGLARIEFIFNSWVKVHPLAILNFEELHRRAKKEPEIKEVVAEIERSTAREPNKVKYFIDCMARGVGRIAAAFHPKDVIVRLSDLKTNEYRNLVGGFLYEPTESNPMIGWRGASRYVHPDYREAFGLECQAIKRVREDMGLTNVKVMIPFCRTPEEGLAVIETMREFGLVQGENGLEIYVMAEIPSNFLQAEEFADIFDGFSIGSNDLTQLTLGLDRDSGLLAHLYDERNSSVQWLIRHLIATAKDKGKKVGICGQAPSDFPDFAAFLVECGIDSISLNADTVIKTRLMIAEKEKKLGIIPPT